MVRRIIGIVALFGGLLWMLSESLPGVWRDTVHRDQFQPASGSRMVSAKCTTWNFFIANRCEMVVAVGRSGELKKLTDWRLGSAPKGSVMPLEAQENGGFVYSTNVSIATLDERVDFAIVAVLISIFFLMGSMMLIAKQRTSSSRGLKR